MSIKFLLYLLVFPFVCWAVEGLRLEVLFKKNKGYQIIFFYVFVTLGVTYLVVNFIYDFYDVSRLIY